MKNIAFAALFSGLSVLLMSHCGKHCSPQPPKHIFEMELVAEVVIDFLPIQEDGQGSVSLIVPDAFVGEFYMVAPALPDEPPGGEACMDVTCDVVTKGTVTVTAYTCFTGVLDPPPTKYILSRTKR